MKPAKNHLIIQISTLLTIALLPIIFLGCTKDEGSAPKAGGSAPPAKASSAQEQIEKDLFNEQAKIPTVVDNVAPAAQNDESGIFRFSNEAQRFTLTNLGQLVNSEFQCKGTLKLAIREKEEAGTIKLTFGKNDFGQNEFKATWWPLTPGQKPFYIANKKEVCGEKIQVGNPKKAIGSLAKTRDQYVLQYTVYVLDPVSLKIKWHDQEAKPGEMICETLSRQAIAKATIQSCELIAAH